MKKPKIQIALISSLVILFLCYHNTIVAQSIWDIKHLLNVKESLHQPFYQKVYNELIKRADSIMQLEPVSVMIKDYIPSSRDKHDYASLARYAWPDSSKTDGLPYIHKDGLSNPEIEKYDRIRLSEMVERVNTLALAAFFSNDKKYSDKATRQIEVWFIDEETKMNPNLEFAQFVPGINNGKGRSYGVLDAYSFVELLEGIQLLETSGDLSLENSIKLKEWFSDLLTWMKESSQGKEEYKAQNNHGTAFDVMSAAFSLYSGDENYTKEIIKTFPERRTFRQIEPDGRQPEELWRTLSFGYSQYNLSHYLDLFMIAQKLGMPIDNITSKDGRNFYHALDYLIGYLGKESEWEYQQLTGWNEKEQELCKDLYRAWLVSNENKYLQRFKNFRELNFSSDFNLVYYIATEVDNAFATALDQFEFAIELADEAKKEPGNISEGRVSPNTIDEKGNMKLVHPHDWRSGFFPGSLWSIYEYTNLPEWREKAVSFTWPIEEAKWHKGTHDLGFMIYDSFGKGWELTGDKSYADVVVQSGQTLSSRYNDNVKCIRSWDHNEKIWKYPVIIDNLMNLELLFRTTEITGDSIYHKIALNHANTTLKNHFRPDHSSYHVVDYDNITGEVRMKCTHQGYSDDSFWSRGQGWGVYGYTMCYRFTGNLVYLNKAQNIADFILSWKNLPEDCIPYWDMKMPEVLNSTPHNISPDVPRDASAAAVIASAFYELSQYTDQERAEDYINFADNILKSLSSPEYLAQPNTNSGFLLKHSTGHFPAHSEVDVPLSYADYYFLEALNRKNKIVSISGNNLFE